MAIVRVTARFGTKLMPGAWMFTDIAWVTLGAARSAKSTYGKQGGMYRNEPRRTWHQSN